MRKRDLLTVSDLTPEDINAFLSLSKSLKEERARVTAHRPLAGRIIGLFFEKTSTRTRVAFEAAMAQLGGCSVFLSKEDLQITRGETIADTARTLSCYLDGLVIRTYAHATLEEWARASSVPVINGLTDLHHPTQALSDLFTIWEKKGSLKGVVMAYIGDGNNVAHSLIEAAAKTGMILHLACPKEYEPQTEILKTAQKEAEKSGAQIEVMRRPDEAARGADILYTDVWTSMGQEKETQQRRKAFRGYQINQKLLSVARPDALVMHCLPAHRGEEITDEVMDGRQSIVFDQAENRLHTAKALLQVFLGASP